MRMLQPESYCLLIDLLSEVTFNCLAARSVIEKHVSGKVYVDDEIKPKNAYILHPYGMSLLIGNADNPKFTNWLFPYMLNKHSQRKKDEWMQVYSDDWNAKIKSELSDKLIPAEIGLIQNYEDYIEVNTRVNFVFNKEMYHASNLKNSIGEVTILPLTYKTALSMQGSVVPLAFWNNIDDFMKSGIGYSVFVNNEQASTAYSAFVHKPSLEIGIETIEKYRGFGYAKLACGALINYCIENQFTPIWSCRLENRGSYNLAKSLGFKPTITLPYYRLCKNREESLPTEE